MRRCGVTTPIIDCSTNSTARRPAPQREKPINPAVSPVVFDEGFEANAQSRLHRGLIEASIEIALMLSIEAGKSHRG